MSSGRQGAATSIRVRVIDKEALLGPSPEGVQEYLAAKGWQFRTSPWGTKATIWAHPCPDEAGDYEVLAPSDKTYGDYAQRMAELLRTLSIVEDRSELDVLRDLCTSSGVTEESSGDAAERMAADLNERFGAGITKVDRLFLEQVLLDAMDNAGVVATAIAHRFGDYEDDDEGFLAFNLWLRHSELMLLVINRLERNKDLGDMIGRRPSGPPGLEEGLKTGIAKAVYEASVESGTTENSRLMGEADRYLKELIDEFGEPSPEDLARAQAFVESLRETM